MSTIVCMDKLIDYVNNGDINDLVYRFYGTNKIEDDYILDKINLLKSDLLSYWRGLDSSNKIRFVEVVNSYDKSKKYKVKYPKNMVTVIENGRACLILR
jgi:hypothetical protein